MNGHQYREALEADTKDLSQSHEMSRLSHDGVALPMSVALMADGRYRSLVVDSWVPWVGHGYELAAAPTEEAKILPVAEVHGLRGLWNLVSLSVPKSACNLGES